MTTNEIRNLLGNREAKSVALRVHFSRLGVGRFEEVLKQILLIDFIHSYAEIADRDAPSDASKRVCRDVVIQKA